LTTGAGRANNAGMPFGLFAREWERTCAECGYTWRVPRAIARRRMGGMGAMSATAAESSFRGRSAYAGAIDARAELMEGFRVCAKCGADHFTQSPVPRRG
jgi:hypothetical protein